MGLKYILIPIVASSLVVSVYNTKTDIPGRKGVQTFSPLSTNSFEMKSSVLHDVDHNSSRKCVIHIPPLETNCHKKKQRNCQDNFSELMAHNNSCLSLMLACICVTYEEKTNMLKYGDCIYNCGQGMIYTPLPPNIKDWNDELCGKFHRRGSLCGSCQTDTYLLAYSFNISCVKCGSNYRLNWLKFFFFAFFLLTVVYFVILFFHISIPSSPLLGYTLNAQLLSAPAMARVYLLYCNNSAWCKYIPLLGSILSIWNLDFFRYYNLGICLKTDTLQTLALDLIVGVYPLVLIAITYIIIQLYDTNFVILMKLWKPFERLSIRFNWSLRTSVIDSFASFLLLSNVKFLSACTDILIPVQVISSDPLFNKSSSSWRMYYDASIEYFGPKHCPYAITAIVVLVVFVVLPTLLLLLYPFQRFQFILNKFPPRWQIFTNTFVESFQGCYKDGTGRYKSDYRWASAFPFLIRILCFALYCTQTTSSFIRFVSMLLVMYALIMIYLEPFKKHTMNKSIVLFILLVGYFSVSCLGVEVSASVFLPILLIACCSPHLVMITLLFEYLFHKVKTCFRKCGTDGNSIRQDR